MSFKAIVLIALILIFCVYAYLKSQVMGSPDSRFNQTTRFVLARRPVMRTLLGLHNPGDARDEYLTNSGPLVVEWFQPITEDVNSQVVQQFADLAGKYTGRQAKVIFGGSVSAGTITLSVLDNLGLKGANVPSGSSIIYVIFATDYQPRDSAEFFTTHGETTMAISLNANRQFLTNYPGDLNNYLLSDMLRGFGDEIGLNGQTTDSSCIMDSQAGENGRPLEYYDRSIPQDFCPAEQDQIKQLKLQY
jgi:hypothetical protein